MKKIPFFAVCVFLAFLSGAQAKEPLPRGLFVSVMQNPTVFSSRAQMDKLIDFAKKAEIKILFVQIYRANKAWFPSQMADSRPYETDFKNLSEDPFELLIKKAHQEGIEVHAWLNLLSLSVNKDAPILKKYGTDILTRNLKAKKKIQDYKIDGQYFLEPGDPRVKGDLLKIVEEILTAYPALDGIQFDYIRYPDKDPHYGFTKINMERFKKATGLQTIDEKDPKWKKWKRDQVTELLTSLVNKSRQMNPQIQVSSTGCMSWVRAYHEAFQDWPYWVNSGLIDFVTIMSYTPDLVEFEKWMKIAQDKTVDFSKVKIGVGAYKFVGSSRGFVLDQQFRRCEKTGNTCVIFYYGSLLEDPALTRFFIRKKR